MWFYRDLFFNLSFIFLTEIFEICIKNVYLNKKSCENPCKMLGLGPKKTRSGYMNTVKSPSYKLCIRLDSLVVTVFTQRAHVLNRRQFDRNSQCQHTMYIHRLFRIHAAA